MVPAPILDGLSLDPFTLLDDGWSPAEVGVGGRHVVQALVVTVDAGSAEGRLGRPRLFEGGTSRLAQSARRPMAR